MSIDIKVPPLGESITEATIASWTKSEGDYVQADEMLAELETDKVTLEVNAPAAGILQKITAGEGDTVEVGAIIGAIDESASAPAGGAEAPKAASATSALSAAPTTAPASSAAASGTMSPAAQKIATEQNIAVASGTGKDGRVTKGDVLAAAAGGAGASVVADRGPREERVRMTKLRQKIAERLKESQDTAAILTTFNEIDMSHVMKLRSTYKDDFLDKHDTKLGFMSFFVKAAIKALKEIPFSRNRS